MRKKGLSRRSLFKYMAAGSATVAAAGCQRKPEKVIPLLVPPDGFEYKPHQSYHYMTTCQECSAGCGMMVTAREGRAQKAEGNPKHPVSQGALCARGQASLQTLYNPERISGAFGKSGESLSWSDAYKMFQEKLQAADGRVVYLSKMTTGTKPRFIDEWLRTIGGGKHIMFQSEMKANEKQANHISFGVNSLPTYEFQKAKYLLNFSTDFLETWGSSVENARKFANMHAYKDNHKNPFIHVGPHVSLTGASADEWLNIKPGCEGIVALAMAYEVQRLTRRFPELRSYLSKYKPETVAREAGVSVDRIKSIAQQFASQSPSLAVGGGHLVASEHSTETLVAVNILNAVAGNIGKTVQFLDQIEHQSSHEDIDELLHDLRKQRVKVLIIDEANPVYSLPVASKLKSLLKNTFVVALSSARSETTEVADLVLSTLTPYETWGDSFPRSGVYNLLQPVMAQVKPFDAKAKEDILIEISKIIDKTNFSSINNYLEYLKNAWKTLQTRVGNTDSFNHFWIQSLEAGGVFKEAEVVSVKLRRNVVQQRIQSPKLEGEGLALLPSSSLMMGDGSGATKPWLQEVPDPLSQVVWDSWMEIHPDTAKGMGISDREQVKISTPYGQIVTTALYHFGIHKSAIAVPFGQGHQASGSVADGFGVNVLDLLPFKRDIQSGEFAWLTVNASVQGTKQPSHMVNLDGNARQIGRNIAAATTVSELKHGVEHHAPHRGKELTEFYPDRKETAGYYKPYRWGMTIDLERCNGCSACVVACYAENNIPVVGKERAALGREMSWIRIERYIEGYGDSFEVRFSPMTCQHCENAGCEPVCPVYATYHTPEGLNAQVYNRCVGTRYCSNNCAYKVRRFNWFNYQFPAPLDQQLNSTITTRSVGVMEKCTFCVQRIREAQHSAKRLGRDLKDGEVVTACQQTCPTEAITFGNLSDPQSQVALNAERENPKKRERQYEVLPELNYKPAITYLKKVKLKGNNSSHAAKHHAPHHG